MTFDLKEFERLHSDLNAKTALHEHSRAFMRFAHYCVRHAPAIVAAFLDRDKLRDAMFGAQDVVDNFTVPKDSPGRDGGVDGCRSPHEPPPGPGVQSASPGGRRRYSGRLITEHLIQQYGWHPDNNWDAFFEELNKHAAEIGE